MVDLNSLYEYCEVISAMAAAGMGFWKLFITPSKKFKSRTNLLLKNLNDRINTIQVNLDNYEPKLQAEVEELQKEFGRDITDMKDDIKKLNQQFQDQTDKTDAKNDRLLDLIIKYFSGKSD